MPFKASIHVYGLYDPKIKFLECLNKIGEGKLELLDQNNYSYTIFSSNKMS